MSLYDVTNSKWKDLSNHIDVNKFKVRAYMMQQTWLSLSTKDQCKSGQFGFFNLLLDLYFLTFLHDNFVLRNVYPTTVHHILTKMC